MIQAAHSSQSSYNHLHGSVSQHFEASLPPDNFHHTRTNILLEIIRLGLPSRGVYVGNDTMRTKYHANHVLHTKSV